MQRSLTKRYSMKSVTATNTLNKLHNKQFHIEVAFIQTEVSLP